MPGSQRSVSRSAEPALPVLNATVTRQIYISTSRQAYVSTTSSSSAHTTSPS